MSIIHPDISLALNHVRIHDRAVRNWVASFGAVAGSQSTKLNTVFASPERAFAAINLLLEKTMGARAEQLRNGPYPYASITRTGIRSSPERVRNSRESFRTSVQSADRSTSFKAGWPVAIDLNYQIDFWSRTVESADNFQSWFLSETIMEGAVVADFTPVWSAWGSKILYMSGGDTINNSSLEAEESQRVVRVTAPLTLKGWLLTSPVQEKNVLKVLVDYRDMPED